MILIERDDFLNNDSKDNSKRKKVKNANGQGSYSRMKDGRIKWKQMIDGQERQITARTQQELQEKIKKVANLPIVKGKLRVDDWFEKWLNTYIKPLKEDETYNQYNTIWKKHINPRIGKYQLKNIKRINIQEIISDMNTTIIQPEVTDINGNIIIPEKVGYSTWTMKHARKVLNLAFSKALDDKLIAENPVKNIEIPNKQPKERKTISPEDLGKIFKQLKTSRWYWCFKFLLVTGLRRGEVLALKWSNIDYKNKKIVVEGSNKDGKTKGTKSAKVHYVPLSEKAIYYLSQHKNMLLEECNPILHNDVLEKSDLIFPNESGKPLQPKSLTKTISRAAERSGIHVTPHMLRHTFVYMNKGLLSLSELQEALGHDESTSTLDIYGTMLSDTETVAKKIDVAFKDIDEEVLKIENRAPSKVISFNEVKKQKMSR